MNYNTETSERALFAVDHQTGDILTHLNAAGMLGTIKSVRVPVLLAKDRGYHVLELPDEWRHLLAKGIKDTEVLFQFAQLRVSYRVEEGSHDSRSQDQRSLRAFDYDVPF
jgi:hypothetical protein